MAKNDLNNLAKSELSELISKKNIFEMQRYQQTIVNVSEGRKNSNKTNDLKRKIAQIETMISRKLLEKIMASEAE